MSRPPDRTGPLIALLIRRAGIDWRRLQVLTPIGEGDARFLRKGDT